MKVTSTAFLAIMAASGVLSGPLQKRMEVTVTTTETVLTTVTVDGPGETPTPATTTPGTATTTSVPASSVSEDSSSGNSPGNPNPGSSGNSHSSSGNSGSGSGSTHSSAASTQSQTPETPATTTGGQTTTQGGSNTGNSLIDASLDHHNRHRLNHTVGDLSWNQEIADYAAVTAATCTFAHDIATGGGGYGQNIAMWASTGDVQATGKDVFIGRTITEMWYNGEIEIFPASSYGEPDPDMALFTKWAHYTQVVWKDTTSVGCAVQYCEPGTMVDGMGAYFSVCNYSPPGNYAGEYGDNVLPPGTLKTYHAD